MNALSMNAKSSRETPEHDGLWNVNELEDKAVRPVQWGQTGSGVFKALSTTRKKLKPGVYAITLDKNDGASVFIQKETAGDDLILLGGSKAKEVIDEIKSFWSLAERFKERGFLHRRGYLLYGPQGTGKSSIIQQVAKDTIERDGVVFLCANPAFFSQALRTFRDIEPARPIMCVFEDIDAIIKRYGEDELLSILDGANQINTVLNLASTNYPEVLDRRIISRPRRFDRVYKIGPPSIQMRSEYMKSKLPKGEPLKKWLKATEGLSFAGMTEALISVLCFGNDLNGTIKILTDIEHGHPSSEDFGYASIGFEKNEPSNETMSVDLDD